MRRTTHTLAMLGLASMMMLRASSAQGTPTREPSDLSWVRGFTVPVDDPSSGRGNLFTNDPRFVALLSTGLRQHQFFWRDHGRFDALPELTQTFLGVPGKAVLREGRFATVDGCVPHACNVRGMIWIDTSSKSSSPLFVFVAASYVSGEPPSEATPIQLWMFSSRKLDWQHLPPTFSASVVDWWTRTSKLWEQYSREQVQVVSLVQPSGEIVTLSPAVLSLDTSHR